MKKLLVLTFSGAIAIGLSFAALAGNPKQEITTAHTHAMMAQGATTVDMAHTHLHHVINCLIGSSGEGFDASAGTPCKGQGNGAIPDSAGNAAVQGKLKDALSDAKAGLKATSLATVHSDAGKAAAALQDASARKASGG